MKKSFKIAAILITMASISSNAYAVSPMRDTVRSRHFNIEMTGVSLGYHRYKSCPALTVILENSSKKSESTRVKITLENDLGSIVHISDTVEKIPPTADTSFITYNNYPYCSLQLEPGVYSYNVELYKQFSAKPARIYEDVATFYK